MLDELEEGGAATETKGVSIDDIKLLQKQRQKHAVRYGGYTIGEYTTSEYTRSRAHKEAQMEGSLIKG